jgi:Rhodopirellula transposase DDE domain
MNWRGRPLTSHEVIVQTIAATTARSGLTVSAELDTGDCLKGIKIPDREIKNLEMLPCPLERAGTGREYVRPARIGRRTGEQADARVPPGWRMRL